MEFFLIFFDKPASCLGKEQGPGRRSRNRSTVSNFSPELTRASRPPRSGNQRWRVILYNNNFHRLNDVVVWLQDATGYEREFNLKVCHTCHDLGRAVCFQGSRERCHDVVADLRRRGLQVEVDDY